MIKAAESAMLESQRRLKLVKDSDEINAQVPRALRWKASSSVRPSSQSAVSSLPRAPGDAAVWQQRLWESTACPPHIALHHRHRHRHRHRPPPPSFLGRNGWRPTSRCLSGSFKLAAGAGELAFTEDVMALGGELQLQRLKEMRGTRNLTEARAIYVDETQVVLD